MDTTEYEALLNSEVEELHTIAETARSKQQDPREHVETDIANNIAERCEKLIGVEGLQDLIIDLEDEGYGREEMAFEIAEEFANGTVGDFDTDDEKVEAAIRTAVALLTEGVVAAPIDGIGEIRIEENDDGTQFIRIPYFGPIRSAGGTGQALSVLVADHIRQELGISKFKPRDNEIHRYVEEMQLYEDTTGLQYTPKEKEVKHIIENCPIMVDGVQTEDKEVGGYRDLERIDGNCPRGGMCLVVGEGIAQKAPKIQRYVEAVGIDDWEWIDELVEGDTDDSTDEDKQDTDDTETEQDDDTDDSVEADGGVDTDIIENTELNREQGNTFEPSKKFKADAVGGRPIFGDGGAKGSFRLRYGRSRNTGLASSGFNPASMVIADQFIATGTQLKTERPGKAQGAVPVTTIEGPTVRLYNGTVTQINTEERAKELTEQVEEIIDLGEMLVTHGEFLENNHDMAPAPWTPDWWHREYLHAGGDPDKYTPTSNISIDTALTLANKYDIPLHPDYTYFWSEITPNQYSHLSDTINKANPTNNDENTVTITVDTDTINILEALCIEHTQDRDNNTVTLNTDDFRCLKIVCDTNNEHNPDNYTRTLDYINEVSPVEIRKRVTVRIGTRMGRPEKSEYREMDNSMINALFPVNDAGRFSDVLSAAEDDTGSNHSFDNQNNADDYKGKGVIETQLSTRRCPDCETETWRVRCPDCNTRTNPIASCYNCNVNSDDYDVENGDECPNPNCNGTVNAYEYQELDINKEITNALETLGLRKAQLDGVKGVEGLSSATKIVEPPEKGLLRARHNIGTFRDGTSRFDMLDLPLTHFKPNEANITVEQANELGYTHDINGNKLTDPDQVLELQKQDIIISDTAADYMLRVANYIDDLLEDYYEMDAYYNATEKTDLVGELVAGLAPHTSAGVVGRIVGYSHIKAHYGHPIFHAAKRRNCFHPDTKLTYKLNGNWKQTTIQQLVEQHLDSNHDGYDNEYADGSIVQHLDNHPEINELKVPSMTDDGHRTLEPVSALSKHEPTNQMVTLTFEDGEELTVTPDHDIPVQPEHGNNTFEKKEAQEIQTGDTLYDYNDTLLEQVKHYPEIDTLQHIIEHNDTHNLNFEDVMLRGLDKDDLYELFTDALKDDWDNGKFYKLQSTADYLGMSKKTLSNYLYRDSFPLSILVELYDGDTDALVNETPRDITLGVKRDNTETPRIINLDEELACLIGYYTAEGFTRNTNDDTRGKNSTGVRQVDFAATEDQARTFIETTLEKKFNVENAYKEDKRITASGTLITYFFDEVVDAGRLAHTKEVPELIKTGSDRLKGAYLSGYISGDGTYESGNLKMLTVSEQLRDDLEELIKSLNLIPTIRDVKERVLQDAFPEFYDEDDNSTSRKAWTISIDDANEFVREYGIQLKRKEDESSHRKEVKVVSEVEQHSSEVDATYNITVDNTNRLEILQTVIAQCDGDEDSIMLLLDGFLNFSEQYLPDRRGTRSMDAPLLMTSVVDPEEIDDEAHNVTTQREFPLEFYYKSQEKPGPKEMDIPIVEDMLDGEGDVSGLGYTTETGDIGAGPYASKYNEMSGMDNFVEGQLGLASKTRAIDASFVAAKVIEKHLLPDILGCLTSFTKQEFMCNNCYEDFRFPPFGHECPECGGGIRGKMPRGGVTKYVDLAKDVAETYDVPPYMQQRLEVLDDRIESLLEDDTNKQAGLGDFM